jgi:hypothetical protein
MEEMIRGRRIGTVLVTMAILAAACGGSKGTPSFITPDGSGPADADGAVLDGVTPEVAVPDLLPPDETELPGPDLQGGGVLGETCLENGDCLSGFCLYGACTEACEAECPPGYACALHAGSGLNETWCLPLDLTLCSPCFGSEECPPPGWAVDPEPYACINYGVEGFFCAQACAADADCAPGYLCAPVTTAEGDKGTYCRRKTGVCTCSGYGTAVGATTSCPIGNEIGTCPGERTCGEEGLTECFGDAASEEVCDAIDNDCDGKVDEGLDLESCTVENEFGLCTGPLVCVDGEVLCDAQIPTTEACDKIDNDCDGETDEGFPDDNGNGVLDCLEGDVDEDGIVDAVDNCMEVPNPGQENGDNDDLGDACDPDDDNDGVPDGDDCEPLDPAISPNAKESCNGLDDDCDGETDEGFPDSNGDGTPDCMEADSDGDAVFDYEDNCPNTPNPSQQDLDQDGMGDKCDDDDDGDGHPDGQDCAPLNPAVHPGADELCNGQDDDCDGESDEGFPDDNGNGIPDCLEDDSDNDGILDFDDNCMDVPNPQQTDFDDDGEGDACDLDDDNDGALDEVDCAPFDPAVYGDADEICDAIDNNCNGETDEGLGMTTCGLGICLHTIANCVGGVPQECDPLEGASAQEECDELDNDCDGEVDEDFPDNNGNGIPDCLETDTDGDGVLDADDNCPEVANADQADFDVDGLGDACDPDDDGDGDPDATDCEPHAAAIHAGADELCNGVDDDCDAATDEGFGELTCGVGACQNTVSECVDGVLHECLPGQPTEELCNGLDDDCDGETDEGFPDDNGNGVPDCLELDGDGDGVLDQDDNCPEVANPDQDDFDADGLGDACDGDDDDDGEPDVTDCEPFNPAVFPAAPEVCNGSDDNCSGEADEGFGELSCGIGACKITVIECLDGVPQECVPGLPADEVCDAVDNDCDGETDEGFEPVTCGLGPCEHTVETCLDGVPAECDPLEGAVDEVCDGLDNDCDGGVDEDFGELTCGIGACQVTVPECLDGVPQECVPGQPTEELCNGLDDDCDGEVDETGQDCTVYYLDADGDSFGTDESLCACAPVDAYTALVPGDCDDTDGAVNPNATELCADAVDNDCNPETTCNEVKQGASKFVIDTVKGDEPAATFISYGTPDNASSNTGLELSNMAQLFLYRDPAGQVFLVLILDAADDGSGGAAEVGFTGLYGATTVISDDPGEATVDPVTGIGTGVWTWSPCCTDGVVYGPLGCEGEGYSVTVKFKSYSGINGVVVRDGTGGIVPIPDPTKPIVFTGTVDAGPVPPVSAHPSCKAILDAGESTGDGVYWIDPDGAMGMGAPMQVLCDMTTDGGGWTLCGKFDRDNPWGEGSLPAGWARGDLFDGNLSSVDGFCAQGVSMDCRMLVSNGGATQILSVGTNVTTPTWAAGRIIDLPAEVQANPLNLWNVAMDEDGLGQCTAGAVITRDLEGNDLGTSDGTATLGNRAALIGDGAFWTNANRNGASFSNAGYSGACNISQNDTVYWAWPDAAGAEDDHGCGANAGALQLGTGCGQGSGWGGKPTYRYNLLLFR